MNTKISTLAKFLNRLKFSVDVSTIVALLVVAIGTSFSLLLSNTVSLQNKKNFDEKTKQKAENLIQVVQTTTLSYDQILTSSGALFTLEPDLTQSQWRVFFDEIDFERRFQHLQGIGYVSYQEGVSMKEFTDAHPEIASVFNPTGDRETYTAIKYLVPLNEKNKKAIGYDMYSESSRRTAMEAARDNGKTTVSAPVQLVQDSGQAEDYPGVLMYYPIYLGDEIPGSIEQRRRDIVGYTYIVTRPSELFKSISTDFEYLVEDISGSRPTTLYTNKDNSNRIYSAVYTVAVRDRVWRISILDKGEFSSLFLTPGIIFAFGIIGSFAIGYLVYRLLLGRVRSIKRNHRIAVQEAKNELIALASHQLRTPASGVKLYLGLITQGMLGEVESNQLVVVEKAYEANERQLEIINQLLYVAKADAGQLALSRQPFVLHNLVKDCVATFKDEAKKKNIKLNFKRSKDIIVTADEKYIRMAIENLVSNAIKYSYSEGMVVVAIRRKDGTVEIEVRDKGVGIDSKTKDMLFKKFSRINNPLSSSTSGSGLGLYLARKIVIAHGGRIYLRPTRTRGSTFVMELPLLEKSELDHRKINLH